MTSVGALVGTPLYMSPEQTRGQNDALDARSDLFSACVMFHELLNDGHHRYEDVKTLPGLLMAIQTTDPAGVTRMFRAEAGVGPEYVHFLRRGLSIDPAARWTSAFEMIEELHAILDGRCRVQCMATFSKRVTRGVGHMVDKSPRVVIPSMMVGSMVLLGLAANGVYHLFGG
jgi:serine/threonine protein kinase